MCLTRIINSSIPKVKYLEPDNQGGMDHFIKNVIVRKPCTILTEGITSAPELGKPGYFCIKTA